MIKKIYSVALQPLVVAGGAAYTNNFYITNTGRQFKIQAITWDYRIQDHDGGSGNGVIMPTDTQTTSHIMLSIFGRDIGGGNLAAITETFDTWTIAPGASDYNGTGIKLFKPCQLYYDSWYVREYLHFQLVITNNDLLLSFDYRTSLMVEILEA